MYIIYIYIHSQYNPFINPSINPYDSHLFPIPIIPYHPIFPGAWVGRLLLRGRGQAPVHVPAVQHGVVVIGALAWPRTPWRTPRGLVRLSIPIYPNKQTDMVGS